MTMKKEKTHFEQVPLEVVKKIAAEMVTKKNDIAGGKRPQRSDGRDSHGNMKSGD